MSSRNVSIILMYVKNVYVDASISNMIRMPPLKKACPPRPTLAYMILFFFLIISYKIPPNIYDRYIYPTIMTATWSRSSLEQDYRTTFWGSYRKVGGGSHRNAQEWVAKIWNKDRVLHCSQTPFTRNNLQLIFF